MNKEELDYLIRQQKVMGRCMLELSTNVSVPFLIYAVMLSLRVFSSKLQSVEGFFVLFCGLKIKHLENK